MIRIDPSPILFHFYFFIRSESVRVDPTRTGGPSWSAPTFVPASRKIDNLIFDKGQHVGLTNKKKEFNNQVSSVV